MLNSLVVAGAAMGALVLGYIFYGRVMTRLWGVDPSRKTPAIEHPDSIDYVPAKHWTVLFGHHFSSIAGAGPIIGPVIACFYFGWLPTLIWVVIGAIFLGAVHDFATLMASLRQKGRSIAQVAEIIMGRRTKILFASFIWLALVLVIAVFAASTAKTLIDQPELVIPTFGLIAVAILVGLMMYRWNISQLLATLIGVGLLLGLILLGGHYPMDIGKLGGIFAEHPLNAWAVALLIYAYFASVTPVNILLQPRDYLATFVLYFGIALALIGLVVTHPPMRSPAYISWNTVEGPAWPMLFVIVACGAISGFHSLIASGTTSKQIASEAHAKRIGFGAMILEGAVAVLVVLCVCAGLFWQGNADWNFPKLMKASGWIVTFGKGYGQITGSTLGWVSRQDLTYSQTLGTMIGIMLINTFIMTTLDSATRIGRYIGEELFGAVIPIKFFSNRFVSTIIIVLLAGCLALGPWEKIWPVFGASNQLVAALALLVVTVLLVSLGKPTVYTLYPAIFMLITTVGALVYQVVWKFIPKVQSFWDNNLLLAVIGIILIILAGFVTIEGIRTAIKLRRKPAVGRAKLE